ncbi:MAG: TOBE domain-containing protein [Sulfurimonas sp.]|uniref:TOBE domain-containing protein n=1 Tax=Sulfurimonas sp. TaxID=2022749 RepID=UPI00262EBBCD|nr:TOBE domain-containing protein [Sulfurimonas sp.]MDD3476543.1 TOBE domain-containing protein [Sulfurimonas sp.]
MKFLSELVLMDGESSFLLQKRVALLSAIEEVGSLSRAAKMVPLSYKGAWDMIDSMNNFCPSPVVEKVTGGVGGGGTKLTEYGKNLVKTYEVIYKEHQKFLETISHVTDFESGSLKFFRRFNMQISARNQLVATIQTIQSDKVNATLHMKLKSGYVMTSVITAGAVENLGVKVGDEVIVIFKSNSVLLSTDMDVKLSAMNKLSGVVEKIYLSEINCEVVVNVGGDHIASVVTKSAIEALDIKVGDNINAIIKSSDVMIGK